MAAHLQCSHCGHMSRSHAQHLTHIAASHPTCLDGMAMGRLGTVLMYQSSGRLYHCSICFYTTRDFSKLYKHIITKHCMDKKEEAGGEGRDEGSEKGEEEEVKDAPDKSSDAEEADIEEVKDAPVKRSSDAEEADIEEVKDAPVKSSDVEEADIEEVKDAPDKSSDPEADIEEVKDATVKSSDVEEADIEEVKDAPVKSSDVEEADIEEVKDATVKSSDVEEADIEEVKDAPVKRSSDAEEADIEEVKDAPDKSSDAEADIEEVKDAPDKKSSDAEADNESVNDAPKRKRSRDEEEEEEKQQEEAESATPKDDEKKKVLTFDGVTYCCLICGWRTKQKAVSVSHLVRKHDLHKMYAAQVIRRDVASISQGQGGRLEDVEGSGLSKELLKEEIAATAKVVSYISSRFVCLICGWKTKIKGFALSHVVRCHDVKCSYVCKECNRRFFLPSQLQHHIRATHRPGCYACPFCWFRSEYLGGFTRHCKRCSAREEEGGEGTGGGEEEDNEDEEESEEKTAWKQEISERPIKEEQEDEIDD